MGTGVWGRLEDLLGQVVDPGSIEEAADRLRQYGDQVMQWRSVLNLTSASSEREIAGVHLFDSLLSCVAAGQCEFERALDLGSGAGFPGIPLAICFPRRRVVLVESRMRRAVFLERCVRILGLGMVEVVRARLSELDSEQNKVDVFTARGVGAPALIWRMASPFLTGSGRVIVNVGPEFEIEESPSSVDVRARILAGRAAGGERRVVVMTRCSREEKDPAEEK